MEIQIESLINEAEILSKDSDGNEPAIYNSKLMLEDIKRIVSDNLNDLPEEDLDQINVGLLAAKALDFVPKFENYANALHNLWSSFLALQGHSFAIPLYGMKKIAYNFYKKHLFSDNKILSHFRGIDFSKSVSVISLNQGYKLAQWRRQRAPQGNYYGELNKTPDCLGIYYMQEDRYGNLHKRIEHFYEILRPIGVLESFANKVVDTWSVRNKKYSTSGGCLQYFNSKDKRLFIQIFP